MEFFKNLQSCFNNSSGGCGWQEISWLVQNLLQSLFIVGLFIAGCMVAYAGWLLIRKGSDSGSRTRVRKIFQNIVLGLILLFSSYYIVDLVLTQLGVTDEFRRGFVEPAGTQSGTN